MTDRIALVGGRVFDGRGGAAVEASVVVHAGVLVEIGATVDTAGAKVIEVTGCTVMPGLIDAHTHLCAAGRDRLPRTEPGRTLRAATNARKLLHSGVTVARDVGGFDRVMPALKAAVRRGELEGPAVFSSNQLICSTGGHGTEFGYGAAYEADGPDGFRRAVRKQVADGADLIKVAINGGTNRVQVTRDELSAAVDEAHRHGLRVACHASILDAVTLAVECGVDSIEHGNEADATLSERMAGAGMALVPTVYTFMSFRDALKSGHPPPMVPEELVPVITPAFERRCDAIEPTLRAAIAAGVRIAAGTDMLDGMPAESLVDEIEALTSVGLTPAAALAAATTGSAAAVGVPGVTGQVAEGHRADLLVVEGRPDEMSSDLRRLRHVLKAGNFVARERPET